MIEFQPDEGFTFSPKDQGGDDARDNDVLTDGRKTVALSDGDEITNLDAGQIVIAALGSVGDRVWLDVNADGIQDAGEPGVADVAVHLFDATGSKLITSSRTTEDGEFLFSGLPAADYVIDVDPPSAFAIAQPHQSDESLDSDPDPESGRFTFTLGASEVNNSVDTGLIFMADVAVIESLTTVSGQVWNDLNNNDVRDHGETPIEGVKVFAVRPRPPAKWVLTDSNGEYRFVNLRAETYDIRFDAPFGFQFVDANQGGDDTLDSDVAANGNVRIDLGASGNIDNLDAGLRYIGSSSIGGQVWDDQNNDGIRDPGEVGVANVKLRLVDRDARRTVTSERTDDLGNYLFSGAPAGEYQLLVFPPRSTVFSSTDIGADDAVDSDVDVRGRVSLSVANNQQVSSVDAGVFFPPASSGITGRVWSDYNADGLQDPAEPGLESRHVLLTDRGRPIDRTVTESGGFYSFTGLVPGTYELVFGKRSGLNYSRANFGDDDMIDSDTDQRTGRVTVTVGVNESVTHVDSGRIQDKKGSIGGFVWYDSDRDGIQDPGEEGIPTGVVLLNATGRIILDNNSDSFHI